VISTRNLEIRSLGEKRITVIRTTKKELEERGGKAEDIRKNSSRFRRRGRQRVYASFHPSRVQTITGGTAETAVASNGVGGFGAKNRKKKNQGKESPSRRVSAIEESLCVGGVPHGRRDKGSRLRATTGLATKKPLIA